MADSSNFQDKTSADKTSIGFDYQFFYFIDLLLNMKIDQKIGYEVKDDIHIELDSKNHILMQTKHTLKTNAQGQTVNLTERDGDLWKTIYNWINVVNDKEEKRECISEQIQFMNQTKFVLISNKASSTNNQLLKKIDAVQKDTLSILNFQSYLSKLISETSTKKADGTGNKLKKHMEELVSQNDEWLKKFLSKIEFQLNQDDLIQKIKNTIRVKLFEVDEYRINNALECIFSNLSIWKYENVKKGEKIYIDYEEVEKKLHKCFLVARNNKLPKRKFQFDLPNDLESQIFIKQLIDINDIKPLDLEQMREYTTYKLNILKHLESWKQAGYITEDELDDFNEECVAIWKNLHRAAHRTSLGLIRDNEPIPESIKMNALNCLDDIRQKSVKIDDEELNIKMSNGQFYHLSDNPSIGWLLDWEVKYKI